jgi:hypothetical protein
MMGGQNRRLEGDSRLAYAIYLTLAYLTDTMYPARRPRSVNHRASNLKNDEQ